MGQKYLESGAILRFTNGTGEDIAAGELVFIGGFAGIAAGAVPDGEDGRLNMGGVWEFAKETSLVISQGDKVFWDEANSRIDKTPTNKLIGTAWADAATNDTTVQVKLDDQPNAPVGAVAAGVEAQEFGDGRNFTTVLDFTDLVMGSTGGAANKAMGKLLYTLPAGAQVVEAVNMEVALNNASGELDADTPDIGVGSVIATGAVAVLGGTATFEDYVTGQTAADANGTVTKKLSAATAGALTGIALNGAAAAKTIHLNVADGWAADEPVLATGRVVVKWTLMS